MLSKIWQQLTKSFTLNHRHLNFNKKINKIKLSRVCLVVPFLLMIPSTNFCIDNYQMEGTINTNEEEIIRYINKPELVTLLHSKID
jgi:hypothetical protein